MTTDRTCRNWGKIFAVPAHRPQNTSGGAKGGGKVWILRVCCLLTRCYRNNAGDPSQSILRRAEVTAFMSSGIGASFLTDATDVCSLGSKVDVTPHYCGRIRLSSLTRAQC